jgi:hypothetical protein
VKKRLRDLCLVLGAATIVAGVAGMMFSFRYLRIANVVDATAGGAGFIAGAILVGSGLVACALVLSPTSPRSEARD